MKREKRNVEWRRHMLALQKKAGAMRDRRTRRNRSREAQRRRAINDGRDDA